MLSKLLTHRHTIWYLAVRQIGDRYAGTWGGLLWAVFHPIALLVLFWFVFEKGLRITPGTGRPFVLELFCGLVPWMMVSESISGGADAITGRAYLVKKIAFPCEILPITHVVTALLTHGVLLLVLLALTVAYGKMPGTSLLMLPYYLVCSTVLLSGFATMLSAVNVFYRDVGQLLGVFLNICFWITPIVWPASMLPAGYRWMLEWNPFAYLVAGYRDSFLSTDLQLPGVKETVIFWVLTAAILFVAQRAFGRLRPIFADVL